MVAGDLTEQRSRNPGLSLKKPFSMWVGGGLSSYARTQRYCYVYTLRRNQDPALITALWFPPVSISNYLNLLFGTGRFRSLKFVSNKLEMGDKKRKAFVLRRPLQGFAWLQTYST